MTKLERLGPINKNGYCVLSEFVKQIPFAYFDAVAMDLFDRQTKLYGGAVELCDLDSVVFGLGAIADINSDDHELYFKKLMKHYDLDFSPNVFHYSARCNYPLALEKLLIKCCKFLENYHVNAASFYEYELLKSDLSDCLNSYRFNDSESNRIRAFYKFACLIISLTFILRKLHIYWVELDNKNDERVNKYLVCYCPLACFYYVPAIKDLKSTWKQIDLIDCL